MHLKGAPAAIGSAIQFGAAMPASKLLLGQTDPWMLAGLLYLGSGIGLGTYRLAARMPGPKLSRKDVGWIAGAVLCGGVVAPVLLMFALRTMSASGAALLLNAEGVFTALLAWLIFREYIGRRVAIGMVFIAAGAIALSWPTHAEPLGILPSTLALAACLAWAIDNNLTRRVADLDATWVAAVAP